MIDKEDVELVGGNAISHLDDELTYEYLGVPQRRMQEVRVEVTPHQIPTDSQVDLEF